MTKRDAASLPLVLDRMRAFEDACHARGLPVTTQRQAIFRTVISVTTHPSADEVYEMVRKELPAISRTTVYRVLDVLTRSGFVQRIPHPSSTARFDGNVQRHHHMVCRVCGRVMDVFDDRYDALPPPDVQSTGFEIDDYAITFTGTCKACRN